MGKMEWEDMGKYRVRGGKCREIGRGESVDMGECISYFEWSPLPYYNIYIYSL